MFMNVVTRFIMVRHVLTQTSSHKAKSLWAIRPYGAKSEGFSFIENNNWYSDEWNDGVTP
jgi:hypothetical protein